MNSKYRVLLLLILWHGFTPLAQSQAIFRSEPRTDALSMRAHADLMVKKTQGTIDIFFEGDSITRRWGTSDAAYSDLLANWTANFHGWNAADFAWGGDTVQNILWSLEDGELEGVNPKVIVLLGGTNNLEEGLDADGQTRKVDEVVSGIRAIVDLMKVQAPDATIILTGILARNGTGGSTSLMPTIRRINARLATLADGESIRYIDINPGLADEKGVLLDGMTVDGLHLSAQGYQVWADALVPLFTELLGPPAPEDHAPPPTGVPDIGG